MIFHFLDMHSGGGCKIKPYEHIFITATDERAAVAEFIRRFDRDPCNITCDCCGEDYSVSGHETLEKAAEYWRLDQALTVFLGREDVLVVPGEVAA